jgi:hypothetical protein
MHYDDIPRLPSAHYRVAVDWGDLESHISRQSDSTGLCPLNLDPDYQRAHVWTEDQQRAFVEYALMGGEVGRTLTLNCPGWLGDWRGPYELVDGKQRLTAVRRFLAGELRVFGHVIGEYEGRLPSTASFDWAICSVNTRAEILQLYININAGGTPHTKAEIDRVRELRLTEKGE